MTVTRTMGVLLAVSVLGLGLGGAAEVPTTIPTTVPATMPAADAAKLVTQLGAEDFQVRDDASKQLRTLGQSALPALNDGLKSTDPEVRGRCESLIAQIKTPERPANSLQPDQGMGGVIQIGGMGGGMIVVQGGGQIIIGQQVAVKADANGKEVNVNQDGRKIHITQNADGIKMTVTDQKDGKDVVTEYAAKDAKELEEKQPEAFKLYQQFMGDGNGKIQIKAHQIMVGPNGGKVEVRMEAQTEEAPPANVQPGK